jgi:MoaA/NifB/PqqE/SkfB family radical SAM enzyme
MFRDKYGIRDLVTCITVTKKNIDSLPEIIRFLTSEGIWSICTPLQCPPPLLRYDYSQGDTEDLPSQEQVEAISPVLSLMASSKRFLMHNEPGWFDLWPKYFRNQSWKCHDKSILTVDADGSLRLCVDIPLKKHLHILDLKNESTVDAYMELLKERPTCGGCFWDPAYESIAKGTRVGMSDEEGRKSFRHELSEAEIEQLIPEAQQWFRKK